MPGPGPVLVLFSGYRVPVPVPDPGKRDCFRWNRVRLFWGFRRVKGEGAIVVCVKGKRA